MRSLRKVSSEQASQLTLKFQLAHQGKSFKLYEDFVDFEKEVHKVKLGSAYLNDKDRAEMITCLAKCKRRSEITQPLNDKRWRSAYTMTGQVPPKLKMEVLQRTQ